MEQALTLVATGTLTVAMAHGSKGKAVALPRTLNVSSGKESMRQTGFSDAAWGKATRSYATSIHSLTHVKFDAIVKAAQAFAKPTRAHNRTSDATEVIDVDEFNERACLVDNSDEDSNCIVLKIFLFIVSDVIFLWQDHDRLPLKASIILDSYVVFATLFKFTRYQ